MAEIVTGASARCRARAGARLPVQAPGPRRGPAQRALLTRATPGGTVAAVGSSAPSDRYEPLPGLLEIPGFLLGKLTPRGRRIAAVAGVLLAAALVVALVLGVPAIVAAKHRAAVADARREARYRAQRISQLRREVTPVSGRGPAARGLTAPATLQPQKVLRADLVAAIAADGARRARTGEFVRRPKRVECSRNPVALGAPDPAAVPDASRSTYACLAVTTDVAASATSNGGSIGYPYSALVDFQAGRFTFCRVSGRPGEMLIGRDVHVAVPRACGGL